MEDEIGLEHIIQFSPPVAVSVVTILGLSLQEWVYIATIIYTILGIITLIKKHWIKKDESRK